MKSLSFLQLSYILIVTLLGTLLLSERSVNIYWDQTYHQRSPIQIQWDPIDRWKAEMNQLADKMKEAIQRYQQWDDAMIEAINRRLIFDTTPSLSLSNVMPTLFNRYNFDHKHPLSASVLTPQSNDDMPLLNSPLNQYAVNENALLASQHHPFRPAPIDVQPISTVSPQLLTLFESPSTTDQPWHNRALFMPLSSDRFAALHRAQLLSTEEATEQVALQQIQQNVQLIQDYYDTLSQKERDYLASGIIIRPKETIFFAGDSLMQGVAPRVIQQLSQEYHIHGKDLSKQSTGLSYPNAFNWPRTIKETLESDDSIKALVLFLGPNDPWDFLVAGEKNYFKFQSAPWEETYRSRIQEILNVAKAHHVKVIWLGVPCMKKDKLNQDMIYLNTLYADEVHHAQQRFVPTDTLLGCEQGVYTSTITKENKLIKVRTRDGIHFEWSGQRFIADEIIKQLTFIPY